jgi:hypothetical protein
MPWNVVIWEDRPALAVGEYLRAEDLCVFSNGLAPRLWEALVHRMLSRSDTVALVCPKEPLPFGRPLIINEDSDPSSTFLLSAVRLCKTLDVAPVVLTVARFEGETLRRERAAEAILRGQGVAAEFDSMACADVRRAVALVARCRGCSHVFVERRHTPPWWRWLHRDTLQGLLGLTDPLTLLTFSGKWLPPEADAPTSEVLPPRTQRLFPHSRI